MKANERMHSILEALAKAIEALLALEEDKAFQAQDWPNFLARSSAQAQQLYGRLSYAFSGHKDWKDLAAGKFKN